MAQQVQSEIRYLTPPSVDVKKKKYCRFKKSGIKYIDYKDPEFLKKFLNEQGKILPRRITGTSLKLSLIHICLIGIDTRVSALSTPGCRYA